MKKALVVLVTILLFITNVYAESLHNVTFKSENEAKIVSIEENNIITPPVFTKEGYELLGWTVNGVMFDFETPITSDMELIAVWQKDEKVTVEEPQTDVNQPDEEENLNTKEPFSYTNSSEGVQYLIIIVLALVVGLFKYVVIPKIKKR